MQLLLDDLIDFLSKFFGVLKKQIYHEVHLQKLVSKEHLAIYAYN